MIDPAARGAWRDLESKLRPFIARRVRLDADVDDVVQDVFLKMQRGLAGLRDEERFAPWVYQVARSAIVDHRRRAAKHRSPLIKRLPRPCRFRDTVRSPRWRMRRSFQQSVTTRPGSVLISDLGLPDGSGYGLLETLRNESRVPPAIALSGYDMAEDRERSQAAGFVEHLVKPVDVRDLQQAIERAIEVS